MLTLKEAREIRKKEELKAIIKFIVFALIIAAATYIVFRYTDILTRSSVYYLVPAVLLLGAVKLSRIHHLFTTREFIGEVLKNEIFVAEERKTKSGGFDALQDKSLVSELLIKNENGKTLFKSFTNGPITANLVEGDKIAVLRFVDSPVVIEGKHWKQNGEIAE